jgi:hypothetical protein
MSSNNPCAVYNFYNCCTPAGDGAGGGSFIWQSGNILDPQVQGGTQEVLTPVIGLGDFPDADLKSYQGLMPLHRKARLEDLSILRFAPVTSGPAYTAKVTLNVVVLDFAGTVVRTISTAPMDYQAIPLLTWTPIPLTSVAKDLEIAPGQLVAGELVFAATLNPNQSLVLRYQMSGTGTLL